MSTSPPQPRFDQLAYLEAVPAGTSQYPNDYQAAYEFLLTHQNNPATFNSYRREVERLLLWCESIARLPLSAIDEEAFKRYMTFCQHPPMSWIGHKKVHRFVTQKTGRVPNPDWRPFFKPSLSDDANTAMRTRVGPAKPTIQHLLAILQTFFTFLQRQGYLSHNPVTGYYRSGAAKLKQGTPPSSPKCITQTQWNKLLLAAEQLAHEQPMIHERTLFILTIIHTLQLRPSALVSSAKWVPKMDHFYCDTGGQWWFKTLGKRDKPCKFVVDEALLNAFTRWRQSLNLSPLPTHKSVMPLLPKRRGRGAMTSTTYIRELFHACINQAVSMLQENDQQEEAAALLALSLNNLRHTSE